jgi:glyoxylase-like metal-dependent hydrolase (beta-lactamase superfamily II)
MHSDQTQAHFHRWFYPAIILPLAVFYFATLSVKAGQQPASSAPAPQQTPSPAGCIQDCGKWSPVKQIDFSSKHNVLLRNPDGTLTPMDEPYFRSTLIAPGTWQVLSDGDFSYVIEGDNEALVIDATDGAGNIREYEQSLTKKPIHYVANTHDHFDHTANDAYFDRAFMSAFTRTKATFPAGTFEGITFPRDYPVTVISDGYVFHLGNRDIEVFEAPSHTMGDLAYLDRKQRILFSGDIFSQATMPMNPESSVARFAANMKKLEAHRSEYDRLAGGFRIESAAMVDNCLANAEYVLAGHEGDPVPPPQPGGARLGIPDDTPGNPANSAGPAGPAFGKGLTADQVGVTPETVIYTRHIPHNAGGGGQGRGAPNPNQRRMNYSGCTITYDIRHVTP